MAQCAHQVLLLISELLNINVLCLRAKQNKFNEQKGWQNCRPFCI